MRTRSGRIIEAEPDVTRLRKRNLETSAVTGSDTGAFRRYNATASGYDGITTAFTSDCGIADTLPNDNNHTGYLIVGGDTNDGIDSFDAGLQYSQTYDAWEPYFKYSGHNPVMLNTFTFACGGSYAIDSYVYPYSSGSEILLSAVDVTPSQAKSFSYVDQTASADAYSYTGANFTWKRLVGLAETPYSTTDGNFFGFPAAVTKPKEPNLAEPGIAFLSTYLSGASGAVPLTSSNSTVTSNPNDATRVITAPDVDYLSENSNEYEGVWLHVGPAVSL